jgi:hypothetical protein
MTDQQHDEIKLSSRAMIFATTCLVAISLALVLCLVVVGGVASQRGADLDDLQEELSCRSVIATDFSLIEGELIATVAEALVGISRNEDITRLEDEIITQIEALRSLSDSRAATLEECTRG